MLNPMMWKIALVTGALSLVAGDVAAQGRGGGGGGGRGGSGGGGGGGGGCHGGGGMSQLQTRQMPNMNRMNTSMYTPAGGFPMSQNSQLQTMQYNQLLAARQQQYNQLLAAQMQANQHAAQLQNAQMLTQLQANQLTPIQAQYLQLLAAQQQALQDYKARAAQLQAIAFWEYQRRGAP